MNTKTALTMFAFVVLGTMTCVTAYASFQQNILDAIRGLPGQPWLVATLFDAYFGFLFFYLWVCVRERAAAARAWWLAAILLTGNFAMAVYFLVALGRWNPADGVAALLIPEPAART